MKTENKCHVQSEGKKKHLNYVLGKVSMIQWKSTSGILSVTMRGFYKSSLEKIKIPLFYYRIIGQNAKISQFQEWNNIGHNSQYISTFFDNVAAVQSNLEVDRNK